MAHGDHLLDSNDKRKKPIGNLSAKLLNGEWDQVASVFYNKNRTGAYLMLKVKKGFTAKEGDSLTMFLNSSDFRLALIRRTAIIM